MYSKGPGCSDFAKTGMNTQTTTARILLRRLPFRFPCVPEYPYMRSQVMWWVGNKCEHPTWMCSCTGQGCTMSQQEVQLMLPLFLLFCPGCVTGPWLATISGEQDTTAEEGTCSSRTYTSWGKGAWTEDLDRKISNLAHLTCRFVPVAWPYHTLKPKQTSLCFQQGKPVLCGVGNTWCFHC